MSVLQGKQRDSIMAVAYSYTRFSDSSQGKGHSEERQTDRAEEWSKRTGIALIPIKPDRGLSAYHGRHVKSGHLGDFLAMCKMDPSPIEKGSYLLVEKLDRLSRQDGWEGMERMRDIMRAGVTIVTIDDGDEYNIDKLSRDPMAGIKLSFKLFQSHEESDKKSSRLKSKWDKKRKDAKDGKPVTQRRPAWINKDGSIDQAKADIIRRIYLLAAEGKGAFHITRLFNQEGVVPLLKAKAWSTGLVKYYLNTRTVVGEMQFFRKMDGQLVPEGEPIKGFYKSIIDDQTYARAQRQIRDRKRVKVRSTIGDTSNLFSRMVFNIYDGSTFFYKEMNRKGKGNTKGIVYNTKRLASAGAEANRPDSMVIALDYPAFERSFLTFCREIDPVSIFGTGDKSGLAADLQALQAKIVEVEETLAMALERFRSAKVKTTWAKVIEEADEEKRDLVERCDRIRDQMTTSEAKVYADMVAILEDPASRAKVAGYIRMLVEKIEVLPIPMGVGPHRKTLYLLAVRVCYSSGQSRFYLTDHDGNTRPTMDASGNVLIGQTVHDAPLIGETLIALADRATPEWRNRLKSRLEVVAAEEMQKWLKD